MAPQKYREWLFEEFNATCMACGRDLILHNREDQIGHNVLQAHHMNGDSTDHRKSNFISLCNRCGKAVHRVDEEPYRRWHRYLPPGDRWGSPSPHYSLVKGAYGGPRMTREEVEDRYGSLQPDYPVDGVMIDIDKNIDEYVDITTLIPNAWIAALTDDEVIFYEDGSFLKKELENLTHGL